MQIKDLKVREGNIDLVAEVMEKGEIREFQKFGKAGKVCNAKLKDETGDVSLTLWNEDIDKVKVGDKVHIKNGYVGEWQGEPQLSTGKFGELEVVGESEGAAEAPKTEDVTPEVKEEVLDNVEEEKVE